MQGEHGTDRRLYQRTPASLANVTISSPFWDRWLRLNREVTLPNQRSKLDGRIENLRRAAGRSTGGFEGPYHNDPPVYKWIEAASYELARSFDPDLAAAVDKVVDIIVAAQDDDGYLHSYFILEHDPTERWTNLGVKHELFALGHLIEAAVAHHRATGDDVLFAVACDFADHACETFGPDGVHGYPGHPEVEYALVRLYRYTAQKRYLDLASFFVDKRGPPDSRFAWEFDNPDAIAGGYDRYNDQYTDDAGEYDGRYSQDHAPIREQETVEGHAVKATFLYAGAAAVAIETGEETLINAVERLWENMRYRQMYVTGGIGTVAESEAFGADYDLPNEEAYAETCAAFGNVLWSYQMLQLTGETRYADVIERTLYNGFLAGISLSGTEFCYTNPLAHDGGRHRQEWYHTSCCPPNIARLLSSLERYIYSLADDTVFVDQYIASHLETTIDGTEVTVEQATEYPYAERVALTVDAPDPTAFTLALRVPAWCDAPTIQVDDESVDVTPNEPTGYVHLTRTWCSETRVELDLPMAVQQLEAHPDVADAAGKVALRRGPLVYCVEGVDTPHSLSSLRIPADLDATARFNADLLDGVVAIELAARAVDAADWTSTLYRRRGETGTEPVTVQAVPYYAWDNREPGEMAVWLPAQD